MKINKGIAFPVILVILALLGVGGGVGYTQIKKIAEKRRVKFEEEQKIVKEKEMKEAGERAEKEKMEMEKKKALEEKELRERIFTKAQVIDLKDVVRGKSTGKAWLALYEGKTYHRVKSTGLSKLEGSSFYEGWLIKDAKKNDFFSTGKMELQENGDGTLEFITEGDKTMYRTVVLTSEPNDGNPKPDKHIQEGVFSSKLKNSDFVVVLSDIINKGMMEDKSMMEKGDGMMSGAKQHSVEITASGFSPANLNIKAGDTIVFTNRDSVKHWPASGVHPSHLLCTGFDSLKGLNKGETYSFTFKEAKECPMHDHLNPSLRGKIIVTK